ncbi:hypothetical protein [Proteiniborus sp.]|uniref:hypothetical protein n=1 Tax=Proteiniborus sp. TaxID=2079015 RepID=UPI003317854B
MIKLKSKEEVLKKYVSRYPELDQQFIKKLSEEYDRYVDALKGCNTKEEAINFFEDEIKENERLYKDNAILRGLEGSPYNQYMEILANYGLIVFFRDNILD